MGDAERGSERGGPPATHRRTHSAEMVSLSVREVPWYVRNRMRHGDLSCGRWQERAPACRWQAEPRSLAGASFEVGLACSLGPEIEENSAEAPEVGPVVQCCIELFARGRGHRASSWHSCGSFGHKFGTTAPTHFGMPLHRCQTVGSPAAPPEAPQPKTHSPRRRAPGLHSSPGLQWPHRRLANALWAAVRPSGTHRVLARDSGGHYRPNLIWATEGGDGVRRHSELR